MLTKKEHIEYWVTSSNDDWETVESLFSSKRYVHCLFFAHLVLEKLCKANWVKSNESNNPPRVHNLVKIIQQTDIEMIEEDLIFLQTFSDFQLEDRYPDYLFEINKVCNFEYTQQLLQRVKIIKICLQERLQ